MENEETVSVEETPLLPNGGEIQHEETKIETIMGETEETIPQEERAEKKVLLPFDKRLKWSMITFIAIIIIANQINTELTNYLAILFAIIVYFIGDIIAYMNRGGRLE